MTMTNTNYSAVLSYLDLEKRHVRRILITEGAPIPAGLVLTVTNVLDHVRQTIDQNLHLRRQSLAYAREVMPAHSYTLQRLAEASGMSVSGVRTVYTQDDLGELMESLYSPKWLDEEQPPW